MKESQDTDTDNSSADQVVVYWQLDELVSVL
jgi:hypothetical protein